MTERLRPLVTFALFTYNQEAFVGAAVEAALAQDYSPLEIIISDDCSSDGTFPIVEEMMRGYRGPHVVRLNRNQSNLGLVEHVNVIFRLARGEFIVAAAGDDISMPSRVTCLAGVFAQRQPLVIHSAVLRMDETGHELGVLEPPMRHDCKPLAAVASELTLYIGATGAWNRKLLTQFGPIHYKNAYEDLVFGFRAALCQSIAYVDLPLVKYRVGSGMSTRGVRAQAGLRLHRSDRVRFLSMGLDVYKQRNADVEAAHLGSQTAALKAVLRRQIRRHEMRLYVYQRPLKMLRLALSSEALGVIVAAFGELRFWLYILKRRFGERAAD